MKTATSIAAMVWLLASTALAQEPAEPEEPGGIRHLPVHQIDASDLVRFQFVIPEPDAVEQIVVRYRPIGGGPVREAVAGRFAGGWEARLQGRDVPRPGIAYWVVAKTSSGEEPVFASPEEPHVAHLREPDAVDYEREQLALRGGRRSRAAVRGEYVQLGTRAVTVSGGESREFSEHYYQLEASYAYAFFQVVDEIRLALGRVRGNIVDPAMPDAAQDDRGLDYGSAQITWHAHDLLRFQTGILFGFSHEGFEIGAEGDAIIGQREGTSLTLGVEGVTTLGVTGHARLGWLTIPRLPMGATIEVTTWPVGENGGLRLLFDAAYEIYPGAYVRIEGGYRGWSSTTGGLSAGGEVALAF